MLTMGADPEFFIQSGEDNSLIPIMGLLGGTKEAPLPVGGAGSGYAVQEDNVMAEYNVPAVPDSYSFADVVIHGRQLALRTIRRASPHAAVHMQPSALFTAAQLNHPQAQLFGCSPDFDAYKQGAPLPRIAPQSLYVQGVGAWRFAGGHVHIGIPEEDLGWKCPEFVMAAFCDAFLSIPAISMGIDAQGERRKWYGTPGRYRPTKYGIEYRTLSNHWTMQAPWARLIGFGVECMYGALRQGEGHVRKLYNDLPWVDIRTAITTEDTGLARSLRDYFRTVKMEVF